MSEFLDRLTQTDAPVAREVTLGDSTGTVWFRRLTAGQKEQLLKGRKVTVKTGERQGTVDIDLAANERQRQMLLQFTACDENGEPLFKTLERVKAMDGWKVAILAAHAEEVQRLGDPDEEDDPDGEDEQAGDDLGKS